MRLAVSEHQEQSAYFTWTRLQQHFDPRYENIFAIPNQRDKGWLRMWREGVSRGVPDIFIAVTGWADREICQALTGVLGEAFRQSRAGSAGAGGAAAEITEISRRWVYLPGLFIELKTQKGKVAADQKAWHRRLLSQGYLVSVVRGWDQAREITEQYMRLTA